jgi:hypothetical protein
MKTIGEKRRFWSRVQPNQENCWIWTGHCRDNGYGMFAVKNPAGSWSQTTSHRWAYQDQVGEIPDGWEVDHLCRVRACVRPDHLEAVTIQENRRRRDIQYSPAVNRAPVAIPLPAPLPAISKRNPAEHCRNWHDISILGRVKNGNRMTCLACRNEKNAKRRKGGAHGTEMSCPYGHPYDTENTWIRKRPNGEISRECRTCVQARNRAAYHARKMRAPSERTAPACTTEDGG